MRVNTTMVVIEPDDAVRASYLPEGGAAWVIIEDGAHSYKHGLHLWADNDRGDHQESMHTLLRILDLAKASVLKKLDEAIVIDEEKARVGRP